MRNHERLPILLFSRGHGDADFYYASHFDVENALYVRYAEGDDVLVVATLEVGRARTEARVARVADWTELGWTEGPNQLKSWAEVALRLLAERRTAAESAGRAGAAARYADADYSGHVIDRRPRAHGG